MFQVRLVASLFSLVFVTGFASGVFAGERYLVVMKDSQSFKAVHTSIMKKGKYNFKHFDLKTDLGGSLGVVNATVENSLEKLNTLVVQGEDSDIAKLAKMANVAIVEKEVFHPAPKPMRGYINMKMKTAGASTFSPPVGTPYGITMVKAPLAWEAAHKGSGARVLVLDTGMDTEHPSLKANFEKGKDFTGKSDGTDITDTVGHGTHVSGTIAGVLDPSGFSGVAPEAKILMGRVCLAEGCSNVAIAEGINWGVQEKVDVISMSLGGMWSTPAEKAAIVSAESAGVSIVAATGNDGSARVSFPAALPTVIAVGAVDDKSKKADFSQYGKELAVMAPGVAVVSTVPMGSGREIEVSVVTEGLESKLKSASVQGGKDLEHSQVTDIVVAGLGKPEDFAALNVQGKYVLVSRGEIAFGQKAKNALAAKAAGILFYNNEPGLIHAALTQDGTTMPIAAAMIEQSNGEQLKALINDGKVVQASIVTVKTDFSAFDGTSMATPHVAGVVALIKAANKNLKPAEVKALLQKTAQALGPNTNNEYGAGLVNAEAAVNAALGR